MCHTSAVYMMCRIFTNYPAINLIYGNSNWKSGKPNISFWVLLNPFNIQNVILGKNIGGGFEFALICHSKTSSSVLFNYYLRNNLF